MKKILFSLLISILFILTKNFYPVILTGNNSISFNFYDLILLLLISALVYFGIGKYDILKIFKQHKQIKFKYIHICLIVFVVLLFGFIVNYTTTMNVTTHVIWSNILNDTITNAHPVINTFFLKLGTFIYSLTNDLSLGVLVNRIVLFIFNFIVYSILNCYIWKKTNNFKYLIFSLIWTLLLPINFVFQATVWKDTYFVGFSILFLIMLYEIFDSHFKIVENKLFCFSFILVALVMILIRSNALPAFLLLFVFLLIKYKKLKGKKVILLFSIVILSFLAITKIILPIKYDMNVSQAESSAVKLSFMYSLVVEDKMLKEDKLFVNSIMQEDYIKEYYNVNCIDSIKFNSHFSDNYFNENIKKFNNLVDKYIFRHPLLFLKSYLITTYQLWSLYCPDFTAGFLWFNISQIPIINLITCPIIYVFLYIYLIFKYRKNSLFWLVLIYPIGIYLTLLFGMPVNISIRYVYILFPILSLVLLPIFKKDN